MGHGWSAANATEGLDPCGDFDPEAWPEWAPHGAGLVQGFGVRAPPGLQRQPTPIGHGLTFLADYVEYTKTTGVREPPAAPLPVR